MLATACRCPADTLLLRDGRSFEGKLLGRDARTVTFEIHSFGIKAPRTFKTENVAIITEGAPDGYRQDLHLVCDTQCVLWATWVLHSSAGTARAENTHRCSSRESSM